MRPLCRLLLAASLLVCAPAARAALDPLKVETEARALVDRWVADQSRGDFADYDSLYAQRFFGVRRAGPREVAFDRAGWMKDRRRMFDPKRPMRIELDALVFSLTAEGVDVSFTQRFWRGTFHDEGKKRMFLRMQAGVLRIADERMLTSTIAARPSGRPGAAWSTAVGLVSPEGVVIPVEADPRWATAAPPRSRINRRGREATRWAVRADRVPETAQALVGQTLELLGDEGQVCSATVRALALIAVVHHASSGEPGEERLWDGDSAGASATPRLVAELDHACTGALVARRPGSTTAPVVARASTDRALNTAALAALHASPAYVALTTRFDAAGKAPWEQHTTIRQMDVVVAGAQQRWLSVTVFDDGGCAESRELFALYAVEPSAKGPRLKQLNRPDGEALVPTLLLDVDGDGWPELLYRSGGSADTGYDLDAGVLRRSGGVYQELEKVRNDYLGCPC